MSVLKYLEDTDTITNQSNAAARKEKIITINGSAGTIIRSRKQVMKDLPREDIVRRICKICIRETCNGA